MLKTLLLDLSVRKKLLCGFGLVLLITLGVALTSQRALESTLWRFDMLLRVNQIDSTLAHARQDEKNFILRGDDKYLREALQAIDEIDRLVDESQALMTRPETIALMQAIRTDAAAYRQPVRTVEAVAPTSRQHGAWQLAQLMIAVDARTNDILERVLRSAG